LDLDYFYIFAALGMSDISSIWLSISFVRSSRRQRILTLPRDAFQELPEGVPSALLEGQTWLSS
jgi:hypothetical protein